MVNYFTVCVEGVECEEGFMSCVPFPGASFGVDQIDSESERCYKRESNARRFEGLEGECRVEIGVGCTFVEDDGCHLDVDFSERVDEVVCSDDLEFDLQLSGGGGYGVFDDIERVGFRSYQGIVSDVVESDAVVIFLEHAVEGAHSIGSTYIPDFFEIRVLVNGFREFSGEAKSESAVNRIDIFTGSKVIGFNTDEELPVFLAEHRVAESSAKFAQGGVNETSHEIGPF